MRVLLVDDHRMFADAIRSLLEGRGVEVVGIAVSEDGALEAARETRPDVVIVDVGIPNEGGLRAGEQIMRTEPGTKVVALASDADGETAREALALGFQGCLTKDADTIEFVSAIRAVAEGDLVVPRQLDRGAIRRWAGDHGADMLVDQLTPRERQVLRMIASAASSETIARRLSISVNTVRSHIQSIFTKLQVHSRLEAVAFAARNGLIQSPLPDVVSLEEGVPVAAGEAHPFTA